MRDAGLKRDYEFFYRVLWNVPEKRVKKKARGDRKIN